MGLLAEERQGVALDALSPKHNPEGQAKPFEDRPLFDVQFQIRSGVFLFGGSQREVVDLDAALAKSVFQANTILVTLAAVRGDGVGSGKGG